jgi:hypothetical protein
MMMLSLSSFAQLRNSATVVMKSGMVIKGEVIALKQNEYIEIMTPLNTTLTLEWADIQTLDFTSGTPYAKKGKLAYAYNDSSYYLSLSAGFPFGLDSWGDPSLGFSASGTIGKSFGPRVNLGVNLGYDFYWWPNTGVIPLGLEVKGRVHKTGFTPFYYMQAGYGFVGYSDFESNNQLGDTKGGIFFAPGLGIMNKTREHSAWFLQFGFKMQKTTSSYWDTFWNGGGQSEVFVEEEITFRRIDIKFGYVFD